jgi:putative methyltransferase (TIGR04325 family)
VNSRALRRAVRAFVPARWLRPIEERFFRVRWTGDYASWAEARASSSGYEVEEILAKVAMATREVRDGRAVGERDGVLFPERVRNTGLLDCLARVARNAERPIGVLDFGGALGSLYWQHRPELREIGDVRWHIVEQPNFVALGRREFESEQLSFFTDVASACAGLSPDILLLSSVLPYLESPHAIAAALAQRGFGRALIDRTGIIDRAEDVLTVQHVPRNIHRARYPCWFFNRERLLADFRPDYTLRREWLTGDGRGGWVFKSFVLERRIT